MREGLIEVLLPGGYWRDGVRHRDAGIRTLTGEDELFVLETGGVRSMAARVSAFLARLVQRLGSSSPVTSEAIGELSVGDREALLLHVRRIAIGDRLRATLSCTHPKCAAPMDLELDSLNSLLLPEYQNALPVYESEIPSSCGGPYRICFRLPNGADQEAASLAPNVSSGAETILRRVVLAASLGGEAVSDLPAEVADSLSVLLAELDPQAEIRFAPRCPECDRAIEMIFDTATYLFGELAALASTLFHEIHLLAKTYHWSEGDILRLPMARRRAYVRQIEQDVSPRGRG